MGPNRRRARRLVGLPLLALVVGASLSVVACTDSEDLELGGLPAIDPNRSTTTQDIDGNKGLVGGAETVEQINALISKLLASNDACSILTQKEVADYKIDPTALASPEVFAQLSTGLAQVFDHLIEITDASIRVPLQTEKKALAQVLDVVNRYIDNPSDAGATDQIKAIAAAPEFVSASTAISLWASENCAGK